MKKFYLFLAFYCIVSCDKHEEKTSEVAQFIDVDISGDYDFYYDRLSPNYKALLFNKYNTTNDSTIFDSVRSYYIDLHQEIQKGRFTMTNRIVREEPTSRKGLTIIKYRSSLLDHENDNVLFKENIILKIDDQRGSTFIPYTQKFTPNIDSLVAVTYSKKILYNIQNNLIFSKFKSEDSLNKKIGERFDEYSKIFISNDINLFNFLYPPIMNELLKQVGKTTFTPSIKQELLSKMREGFKRQTLPFSRFLIEDIQELKCNPSDSQFLLSYVIDVGNSIYIPAQAIAFVNDQDIYFIEYDKDEFETTLSRLFDSNYLKCLAKHSSDAKSRLGLK